MTMPHRPRRSRASHGALFLITNRLVSILLRTALSLDKAWAWAPSSTPWMLLPRVASRIPSTPCSSTTALKTLSSSFDSSFDDDDEFGPKESAKNAEDDDEEDLLSFDGDEDEDDCGDECEIDWDDMPGWEDDEQEEEVQVASKDEDISATRTESPASSTRSTDAARTNFEMMWQLDEAAEDCDIEEPVTCGSEPCPHCQGRGWSECRFCHGSMVLRNSHARVMEVPVAESITTPVPASATAASATTRTKWGLPPDTFTPCRICHQGVEICTHCKGSGWVAGWTRLPDGVAGGQDKPQMMP